MAALVGVGKHMEIYWHSHTIDAQAHVGLHGMDHLHTQLPMVHISAKLAIGEKTNPTPANGTRAATRHAIVDRSRVRRLYVDEKAKIISSPFGKTSYFCEGPRCDREMKKMKHHPSIHPSIHPSNPSNPIHPRHPSYETNQTDREQVKQ